MLKKRRVADLFVQCSLQVRNLDTGYVAMSDCCRAPANSAVVMDNGRQMWRCDTHRGIRAVGPSVTLVELECEDEEE
jgi:hypothetical protein